ncbi:unnamed protein product [Adineta ricciae]|uniref:Uncharacterized protein n=1 Tax=Adineta ricciae TaxID=249248 RepID=A0A813S434_ADIRI|nr:unnamed protein product [Adineta ricciae]
MSSIDENNCKAMNGWFQVLQEKVVFIVGAAGGIGSAICQVCVSQGARVVIADVDKVAADQLLMKLRGDNEQIADRLISLQLDVTDEQAIEKAVQAVVDKWNTISVLINLAAVFVFGEVENISAADWSRNFDVNVRGYALLVKYIAPIMKKQRSGSIIQFGSISGVVAQIPFLPYGADKAAVIQMTKNLAADLGAFNIRCNSISPGLVGKSSETSSSSDNLIRVLVTPPVVTLATANGLSIENFTHNIVKDQCLKRAALPEEIANLVVFLASDLCPFITGANIVADGGYTIV